MRRQLKIWKGENPDDSDEAEHEGPEKVIKYGDSKELDVAGLRRVLRRCVIETYQRSAESAFLLSNKSGGGFAGFGKSTKEAARAAGDGGGDRGRGGHAHGADGRAGGRRRRTTGPGELELLQGSLEKLLKAQQRLVEGQVKVIEGQARMADRQERLSDLEKRILGVLEKPPGR